jgi:hypothetical protein
MYSKICFHANAINSKAPKKTNQRYRGSFKNDQSVTEEKGFIIAPKILKKKRETFFTISL